MEHVQGVDGGELLLVFVEEQTDDDLETAEVLEDVRDVEVRIDQLDRIVEKLVHLLLRLVDELQHREDVTNEETLPREVQEERVAEDEEAHDGRTDASSCTPRQSSAACS